MLLKSAVKLSVGDILPLVTRTLSGAVGNKKTKKQSTLAHLLLSSDIVSLAVLNIILFPNRNQYLVTFPLFYFSKQTRDKIITREITAFSQTCLFLA